MRPLAALLCAIVLATGAWLTLTPTLAGTPTASCEVTDRLAEHHGYDEWDRTVLGPDRRLPDDYEPPDLVSTASAKRHGRSSRQVSPRPTTSPVDMAKSDAAIVKARPLIGQPRLPRSR